MPGGLHARPVAEGAVHGGGSSVRDADHRYLFGRKLAPHGLRDGAAKQPGNEGCEGGEQL